jgi:hypothetical protein
VSCSSLGLPICVWVGSGAFLSELLYCAQPVKQFIAWRATARLEDFLSALPNFLDRRLSALGHFCWIVLTCRVALHSCFHCLVCSLVLVSLAAVFMCVDAVLLSRSLFVKRAVSNGRSSCGAWTEKVLKHAHQPMVEILFLVEESISSSLFSRCFRNGTCIRTNDDDDGRVLTLLEVTMLDMLCSLYPVEA